MLIISHAFYSVNNFFTIHKKIFPPSPTVTPAPRRRLSATIPPSFPPFTQGGLVCGVSAPLRKGACFWCFRAFTQGGLLLVFPRLYARGLFVVFPRLYASGGYLRLPCAKENGNKTALSPRLLCVKGAGGDSRLRDCLHVFRVSHNSATTPPTPRKQLFGHIRNPGWPYLPEKDSP